MSYNRGDILQFVADREKVIRIGVAQHGLIRTILHRRTPESDWEEIYSADFRTAMEPLGFGTNPDILYVAALNGDKRALFQYDLKARKLGRMIFAHPTYDVPAGPPIVSDKTGKVLGVRYEAERPQVYWFDGDYKNYQAMIDNALPGMANDIKNWSEKEDPHPLPFAQREDYRLLLPAGHQRQKEAQDGKTARSRRVD